ncbi:MAG: 50S ribosomal protein L32 [Candidatus Roizmanbacteria bacterium]|nr:MAG: 50S ribosomal protein L32 [Candidatus Roizmanbacteria bacterium]
MTPQPKRKHSTQRKGKRLATRIANNMPKLVKCKQCGNQKLPHRLCRNCNK